MLSRITRFRGWWAAALSSLLLAACGTPAPTPDTHVRRAPPVRTTPGSDLPAWVGGDRAPDPGWPHAAPGSCRGMELALTLRPNMTYSLTTTMLRRGRPYTFTSSARFRWDASRTVIILASKDESARLRVGRNTLERIGTESMSPEEAASHPLVYTRD